MSEQLQYPVGAPQNNNIIMKGNLRRKRSEATGTSFHSSCVYLFLKELFYIALFSWPPQLPDALLLLDSPWAHPTCLSCWGRRGHCSPQTEHWQSVCCPPYPCSELRFHQNMTRLWGLPEQSFRQYQQPGVFPGHKYTSLSPPRLENKDPECSVVVSRV